MTVVHGLLVKEHGEGVRRWEMKSLIESLIESLIK